MHPLAHASLKCSMTRETSISKNLKKRKLPPSWRMPKTRPMPTRPPVDPAKAAVAVDLKYVSDESPGIRRKRAGTGFTYITARGKPVRDEETLRRIKALVIPPAWTE